MSKKENIINFIIILIVILVVVGVAIFLMNKNKDNEHVIKIGTGELKEKVENKDSFILVLTQDTCSHCKSYLPVLKKIGNEYNIDFYDLSTTGFSDEDFSYLRSVANYSGTPTTIFIINGEERSTLDRLTGNVPEYKVIERLKAMGYINE